jgi:chemotaxis protein MotB
MRKRRASSSEGGSGHDSGGSLRWLLTYADMITLLMAFFIMMYSMSVINISKFHNVAIAIRSGFGGVMPGQSRSILSTDGQISFKPSPLAGDTTGVAWQVVKPLQAYINQTPSAKKTVRVYVDRRGLVVSLRSDKVLFDPGRAEIKAQAYPIMTRIAGVIRSVANEVRVEGHTCNLPTKSVLFASNWELSTTRATNVVRYMIDKQGIPAARLSAAGYADTRPLGPNDTEEHRRRNRRVDFVILNETKE